MKITKQELQQIIKEELEAELNEDMYATEDDRPLGTGRSLMSSKDAEKAMKMAAELVKILADDEAVAAETKAMVADLAGLLEKGVAGARPEAGGLGGPSSSADMEEYESDYRSSPEDLEFIEKLGKEIERAKRGKRKPVPLDQLVGLDSDI